MKHGLTHTWRCKNGKSDPIKPCVCSVGLSGKRLAFMASDLMQVASCADDVSCCWSQMKGKRRLAEAKRNESKSPQDVDL